MMISRVNIHDSLANIENYFDLNEEEDADDAMEINPNASLDHEGQEADQTQHQPSTFKQLDESPTKGQSKMLNNNKRKRNQKLEAKEASALISGLIDFAITDRDFSGVSVGEVKAALLCQIERALKRLQGLRSMCHLLGNSDLMASVTYSLINGWIGFTDFRPGSGVKKSQRNSVVPSSRVSKQCLEDVHLVPFHLKAEILSQNAEIIRWTCEKLKSSVKDVERQQRKALEEKKANTKEHRNQRNLHGLGSSPLTARFILAFQGLLANAVEGQELGLMINSGVVSTLHTLIRLIGPDVVFYEKANKGHEIGPRGGSFRSQRNAYYHAQCSGAVFEDMLVKSCLQPTGPIDGPELAKLMQIGTRVIRGVDWKWGDQDGPPPSEGE